MISLYVYLGVSLQDFNNRIDRVAGKIRELLFGKPEVDVFMYPAPNKVEFRSITLLSKAGLNAAFFNVIKNC